MRTDPAPKKRPSGHLPSAPDDPRNVHCVSADGKVDVVWTLDTEAQPKITAGWPGWDEEPRARRRSLLVWNGSPAWRMDIPILLDAWIDASVSRAQAAARRAAGQPVGKVASDAEARVARQHAAIMALWTPASATSPPPSCNLTGHALPRHGGNWVLTAVQESGFLRNVDDGCCCAGRASSRSARS
jgi:hypothetical protein